jgi:hypothetical protein
MSNYEQKFMETTRPLRKPKRAFAISDRPRAESDISNAQRFTVESLPGVVFARVDRDRHFDGEVYVYFVRGVRVTAPGGAWERFHESEVQYV